MTALNSLDTKIKTKLQTLVTNNYITDLFEAPMFENAHGSPFVEFYLTNYVMNPVTYQNDKETVEYTIKVGTELGETNATSTANKSRFYEAIDRVRELLNYKSLSNDLNITGTDASYQVYNARMESTEIDFTDDRIPRIWRANFKLTITLIRQISN
jgi:hypothetical protein